MSKEGKGKEMLLYAVGAIIWMGLCYVIVTIAGWGYSDPAYWGLIILALPVSMVLSAFTLGKKKKE